MLTKFQLDPINEIEPNYNRTKLYDKQYIPLTYILNKSKNKLDEIPINSYTHLAKYLDLYRTLKKTIYSSYNMQVVTNASLKMYELLVQMRLIDKRLKNINVFCNAELPGGFIATINHYIKTMTKCKLNWVASSYISETHTLGDVYGLYSNNINNWLMDNTINGDLTNGANIVALANRVRDIFPFGVDLYTADVGIDVSNDFNNQEDQTLVLNYGQILCGLLSLSINGSMVTKQFTFFTPFNRSLLQLLAYLFTYVYITKPATSRPLNSEVYIVCKKYKGIDLVLQSYLINLIPYIDANMPIIVLNDERKMIHIANTIYRKQSRELLYAYDIYHKYSTKIHSLNLITDPISKNAQDLWIKINTMKRIESKDYLPYRNTGNSLLK